MPTRLFEKLAAELESAVRDGTLTPGDRLPSIRQTSQARSLSVTTVRRAFQLLESRGLVEGRPQSGYFVRAGALRSPAEPVAELAPTRPPAASAEVDVSGLVLSTLKTIQSRRALPLGSPYPDPALFPWRRIQQHTQEIARRFKAWSAIDDIPPGDAEMIRQIARRHLEAGLAVSKEEIVVTVGATEAINLCLQAVARPGDTVAVESPTFYAMLHAIERMGMRAVEVPTHPEEGIELDALRQLIRRQRIDACMVMPNFQNPLGFEMRDENKRELVALATQHDMPLIENGVYNELHFATRPPTTLKSFDTEGLVLFCGSFTKSLTAGVRIGWALPGRYRQAFERLKFLNTLATPAVPQLAVAAYLTHDGWDRHLRSVRQQLAQRLDIMSSMVRRFFPPGTRLSRPKGGYLLWAELPDGTDTMTVYREALDRGITIAPGRIFSNSDLYANFMRLNYSYEWSAQTESALRTLADLAASR